MGPSGGPLVRLFFSCCAENELNQRTKSQISAHPIIKRVREKAALFSFEKLKRKETAMKILDGNPGKNPERERKVVSTADNAPIAFV